MRSLPFSKLLLGLAVSISVFLGTFYGLREPGEAPSKAGSTRLFPDGSYRYKLQLKSNGMVDLKVIAASRGATLDQAPQRIETALDGELLLEAKNRRLNLSLKSGVLSIQGQIQQGVTFGAVSASLGANGKILDVTFSQEVPTEVKAIWLSILAEIQVVGRGQGTEWKATEENSLMAYEAIYREEGDKLSKTKGPIAKSDLASKGLWASFPDDDRWIVNFKDGRPETLASRSGILGKLSGKIVYENRQVFSLDLLAMTQAKVAVENRERVAFTSGALDQISSRAAEKSGDLQISLGLTPEKIIEGLYAAEDEAEFYKKVRAYIRTHPEDSIKFVPTLVESRYDDKERSIIGVALGAAGHRDAEKALRAVIEGRLREGKLSGSYFHLLSDAVAPSQETIRFIDSYTQSQDPLVREAATLALGTALRSYGREFPEDADRTVNEKLDQLRSTKNESDRRILYGLLGNSGSPLLAREFLPLLIGTASQGDRIQMISALRFVNEPDVKESLIGFLQKGSLADKIAAIEALCYQDYDPRILEQLDSVFSVQRPVEAELRKGLIAWLQLQGGQLLDVRERFITLLKSEKDETNRKILATFADRKV